MKHHITMGYIIYTHISTYICTVELEKASTSKKVLLSWELICVEIKYFENIQNIC